MLKPVRDAPIKTKLVLIILLTNVLLLLLVSNILMVNESFRLKRHLTTDLLALADTVSKNSSVGLMFDDNLSTLSTLGTLKGKANVTLAQVATPDEAIFASYYRDERPPVPPVYVDLPEFSAFIHSDVAQKVVYFSNYADVFKRIELDGYPLGYIRIRSDLAELNKRFYEYTLLIIVVTIIALIIATLLSTKLQSLITHPVYNLLNTINSLTGKKDYSIRATKTSNDEFGVLIDEFNAMLDKIEHRNREIRRASHEINLLNQQLQAENVRLGTELNVARQLQKMVLPPTWELLQVEELDIAGFMESANEVGGDYYDVLRYNNQISIGIGDVTGHGLASGVLMLMVQTAIRTLLAHNVSDPKTILATANRVIHDNVHRIQSDKSMSLSLISYQAGKIIVSGQHEELLIVRKGGKVETIKTMDLGFPIGLIPEIEEYLTHLEMQLSSGDGFVLFTDGVTEAMNAANEQYGNDRLRDIISQHWHLSATEIQQAIIYDVQQHIDEHVVYDDITLVVVKQR